MPDLSVSPVISQMRLEGTIAAVNTHKASGLNGSFIFSLDPSCVVGEIKWFWVWNDPDLALLARFAQYHNKRVRIRVSDFEKVNGNREWRAVSVLNMGLEGDRLYEDILQ